MLSAQPASSQSAKPKTPAKKPAAAKTTTTTTSSATNTLSVSNTATTSTTGSATSTTVSTPPPVETETFTPKKTEPARPALVIPSYKEEVVEEDTPPPSNWVNPEHTGESYMGIKEGWFIGADAGGTLFYGDVALYNTLPKFGDWSKSVGNGYSLYFGKKFKWGLSAEIQGFKGTLKGEKMADRLYPRYFRGDVIDYSLSLKYNLSQAIFRETPGRKFFNRFTVYVTVGGGQVLYRSRLYKQAVNGNWYLEKTNSYTTVGIDSAGATSAGGNVVDKKAFSSAWIIPAGGKINFKLNGQTDLVLDLRYVTVLSDKIDSWERSWSHQDKYFYTGIGLNYNLATKSEGDIPDDQRLLRPHKKSKAKDGYSSSGSSTSGTPSGGGGSRKSRKAAKEDKDLEIKMKLYELQLKLFEMQYLMTN